MEDVGEESGAGEKKKESTKRAKGGMKGAVGR